MKKIAYFRFLFILFLLNLAISCGESPASVEEAPPDLVEAQPEKFATYKPLSPEFKKYWYAGVAEVSSYELEQARYGELRSGEAVLIFVTEPFNTQKQVKADRQSAETPSVLKLNRVRKFLTGVYPYSIMSSIFYPVSGDSHALKITTSVQEWCGHVFAQLNNREDFEIQSNSYFETEADAEFRLDKNILEDELWTLIRTNPDGIPTGKLQVIPSLEYLRLKHQPIQAYTANVAVDRTETGRYLRLIYPELNRSLTIEFQDSFPHRIQGWTESYPSGQGEITSTSTLKKTILSPYWQKNATSDVSLRDSLGLGMR